MAEVVVKRYKTADAKAFFAAERTFLHWLSTSVTLGGLAAGLVGVASQGRFDTSSKATLIVTRLVGLVVLALAIVIAIAACFHFYTRGQMLKSMSDGPYDSHFLVFLFGFIMLAVLFGTWITAVVHIA